MAESEVGFLVGVYALASAIAAIPLVSATLAVNRKALLMALLVGFAASNIVVAISSSYGRDKPRRHSAGQRPQRTPLACACDGHDEAEDRSRAGLRACRGWAESGTNKARSPRCLALTAVRSRYR